MTSSAPHWLHCGSRIHSIALVYRLAALLRPMFVGSHPDRVRTATFVAPMSERPQVAGILRLPVIGSWFGHASGVPGLAGGQRADSFHPENCPTLVDQYRPQMRYRGFGRAPLSTICCAWVLTPCPGRLRNATPPVTYRTSNSHVSYVRVSIPFWRAIRHRRRSLNAATCGPTDGAAAPGGNNEMNPMCPIIQRPARTAY